MEIPAMWLRNFLTLFFAGLIARAEARGLKRKALSRQE
jgi:hypothetical protein